MNESNVVPRITHVLVAILALEGSLFAFKLSWIASLLLIGLGAFILIESLRSHSETANEADSDKEEALLMEEVVEATPSPTANTRQ